MSLGTLGRLLVLPVCLRNQFRRYLSIQNRLENPAGLRSELIDLDNPAQQVLDQGLGDGSIYVVVRHLIADAVGAPSQGQFAQIPRTDNDRMVQIGQPEQVGCPLAGLDIFIGDIVNVFPLGMGMLYVL